MRGPPKIVDSSVILGIFNIKKIRRPSKIADSCAILDIFNIMKMKGPCKNICIKMKMKQ